MTAAAPSPTHCQMPMGEMPSGVPLFFDGIIGQVCCDPNSNTHDCSHFPHDWDLGQEGRLMSERWLLVDEVAAFSGSILKGSP